MLDYQNGKIYTIRYKKDNSLIYVGSSCLPLWMRFVIHKNVCYNPNDKSYNHKFYVKIRETNDFYNWYIELYENYPCNTREELGKREGEVMRELKATLNKRIEGRTMKEYYVDNKKERLDYQNQYYQYNKDEITEYKKEYNKSNKDKILEYKKQYYLQNKNKYKQWYNFRKQNKDIGAEQ